MIPPATLFIHSDKASKAFLILIFTVAAWNGAGFYVEVFGRKWVPTSSHTETLDSSASWNDYEKRWNWLLPRAARPQPRPHPRHLPLQALMSTPHRRSPTTDMGTMIPMASLTALSCCPARNSLRRIWKCRICCWTRLQKRVNLAKRVKLPDHASYLRCTSSIFTTIMQLDITCVRISHL